MKSGAIGAGALAVLLLCIASARADVNQQNANAAWRQADQCSHAAFVAYPDYTPTANAARETARVQCLRDHKLPTPPTPSQGGGSSQ